MIRNSLMMSFFIAVLITGFIGCNKGDSKSKAPDKGKTTDKSSMPDKGKMPDKTMDASISKPNFVKGGPDGVFKDLLKPAMEYKIPANAQGDAKKGYKIFNQVKSKKGKPSAGNCVACHDAAGLDGAGDIGPKFDAILVESWKKRGDPWLFQRIADARKHIPDTTMPPTLPTKILSEQDIVHVIAYLKTIK